MIPTAKQAQGLERLATQATEAKRLRFPEGEVPHKLAADIRDLSKQLLKSAPAYLQRHAQAILLTTAANCLEVLELAVDWEAEKLYGVEGLGPFDEF